MVTLRFPTYMKLVGAAILVAVLINTALLLTLVLRCNGC